MSITLYTNSMARFTENCTQVRDIETSVASRHITLLETHTKVPPKVMQTRRISQP